ncbi:hypothetical protein FHR83_007974 [Actinoplanes campanulatus]|uniref:NPCBM/NEW2 domain-containing protein n=1 Tax=Actinoplanes campanulatus TaxID=113559 RepID=A0A7W5AQB1_9ACTN|nr:DUF6209 family protein [Actinoplanes campanulatus]MBB3100252.1 hypothetical protein [Actinoplanes campanulatus]GGN44209.1 hypothetical protein GCM10010109_77180 [Actinoplanes campanulatus]GID40946.1 hypothetical protein Aca09nite_74520 [Actinoplanes campanulatus]
MHTRILALSLVILPALAAPAEAATIAGATPVLHFVADGTEWTEGALEAGRPVLVDYDLARLSRCRSQYAGGDAWSIGVHYRVDGGPIQRQAVTRLDETRHNVKAPASIDLPIGGKDLELWFQAGDRVGCTEYDSQYGANYHYTIS